MGVEFVGFVCFFSGVILNKLFFGFYYEFDCFISFFDYKWLYLVWVISLIRIVIIWFFRIFGLLELKFRCLEVKVIMEFSSREDK